MVGVRPTAMSTASASTTLSVSRTTRASSSCSIASTLAPCRITMPDPVRTSCTDSATTFSARDRNCSPASSTVTVEPKCWNIAANSRPMNPPPMTARRRGNGSACWMVVES